MGITTQFCCDEFKEACQTGTDNEGYGRLIFAEGHGFGSDSVLTGKWQIGTRANDCSKGFVVNFCPFCGKKPFPPQEDMK